MIGNKFSQEKTKVAGRTRMGEKKPYSQLSPVVLSRDT